MYKRKVKHKFTAELRSAAGSDELNKIHLNSMYINYYYLLQFTIKPIKLFVLLYFVIISYIFVLQTVSYHETFINKFNWQM